MVRMRVGGGESNLKEGAQSRHQDADLEKKNQKGKSTDRWVSRGRGFWAEKIGGQRSKEENMEGLKTKH